MFKKIIWTAPSNFARMFASLLLVYFATPEEVDFLPIFYLILTFFPLLDFGLLNNLRNQSDVNRSSVKKYAAITTKKVSMPYVFMLIFLILQSGYQYNHIFTVSLLVPLLFFQQLLDVIINKDIKMMKISSLIDLSCLLAFFVSITYFETHSLISWAILFSAMGTLVKFPFTFVRLNKAITGNQVTFVHHVKFVPLQILAYLTSNIFFIGANFGVAQLSQQSLMNIRVMHQFLSFNSIIANLYWTNFSIEENKTFEFLIYCVLFIVGLTCCAGLWALGIGVEVKLVAFFMAYGFFQFKSITWYYQHRYLQQIPIYLGFLCIGSFV